MNATSGEKDKIAHEEYATGTFVRPGESGAKGEKRSPGILLQTRRGLETGGDRVIEGASGNSDVPRHGYRKWNGGREEEGSS